MSKILLTQDTWSLTGYPLVIFFMRRDFPFLGVDHTYTEVIGVADEKVASNDFARRKLANFGNLGWKRSGKLTMPEKILISNQRMNSINKSVIKGTETAGCTQMNLTYTMSLFFPAECIFPATPALKHSTLIKVIITIMETKRIVVKPLVIFNIYFCEIFCVKFTSFLFSAYRSELCDCIECT